MKLKEFFEKLDPEVGSVEEAVVYFVGICFVLFCLAVAGVITLVMRFL